MLDRIKEFEQEMELNFIDAFLLAGNTNSYFYIDAKSNEDLLDATICFVYSPMDSPVLGLPTLHAMLDVVHAKSELCEIVGIKVFTSQLKFQIVSMEDDLDIIIPLLLEEKPYWIRIRLSFHRQHQLYLGKLTHIQEENMDEKLYSKSYKDALTGLFNRNTLMLHLHSLSNEYCIYGIMIDIDHFKQVNDRYGHEKGDEILVAFGQMLLSLVDEDAIFYRYAGDEFFVQLKCDCDAQVIGYIKRIQAGLQSIQVDGCPITCSMGVAKYDRQHYRGEELLRFADLAMYIAKSKGRNGYHIVSMDEIYEMAPSKIACSA